MNVYSLVKFSAVALVLGAAPLVAQDNQTTSGAGGYGTFGDTAVAALVGQRVLIGNGDRVGEVESIVKTSTETMAVLGIGGFLGFGEHDVAVPLTELTQAEGAILLKSLDMEMLQAMPSYDGGAEALPMDVTVSGDPVLPITPSDPPAAEPLSDG